MLIAIGVAGVAFSTVASFMTGSLWWCVPSALFGALLGNRLAAMWWPSRR